MDLAEDNAQRQTYVYFKSGNELAGSLKAIN